MNTSYRTALSALVVVAALVGTSTSAVALDGYAKRSGTLRAGPGSDYPSVGQVSAGDGLDIHGCLRRRSWCDVTVDGDRGWLQGSRIQVVRGDRRVVITDDGYDVGVPIIAFGMGTYWSTYYSDRPFFREHRYWRRHGFQPPVGSRPTDPGPWNHWRNNGTPYSTDRGPRPDYRGPGPNQPLQPAPRHFDRPHPPVGSRPTDPGPWNHFRPGPQQNPGNPQPLKPAPHMQHPAPQMQHPAPQPHFNGPAPGAPHPNAPRALRPAPVPQAPNPCPNPQQCK